MEVSESELVGVCICVCKRETVRVPMCVSVRAWKCVYVKLKKVGIYFLPFPVSCGQSVRIVRAATIS